jgi:hypothetical protein
MLLKEQPVIQSTKFGLSREFWSGFYEHCWGKYPRILRKPLHQLLAKPEEVLQGLIRGSADSHQIGFFIEYAKQLVDVDQYLPDSKDESIEQYEERVDQFLDGRKFGLIAEHFQIFDSQIWFRIREFVRGLYEFTGLPGEDTKATIFLGNYDRTPIGLHKGSSHNFMFVLHGRKRIRLWPKRYFSGGNRIEHTIKYDEYLEDSILLEGRPGDILYWPSGYWHIGESAQDHELSMGLSLSIFMNSKRSVLGWNTIGKLLNARLQLKEDQTTTRFNQSVILDLLPELAKQSRNAIRELADQPSLDHALQVTMLNYFTATGFTRVPVLSFEESLEETDMIAGVEGSPILWIPWIDDQLLCSVNGHAFSMPNSEEYLQIIRKLNRGSCRTVKKFISNCEMPKNAYQLLKKLLSFGGISVIRD